MGAPKIVTLIIVSIVLLTAVTLPSPFIWMQIGPLGKKHCRFNVPDIYILGMDIVGKDKNFGPIDFAYKFQFSCIVIFILSMILLYIRLRQNKSIVLLKKLNTMMILLFPIWIWEYCGTVISNSDCATLDLKVKLQIGFVFYGLIVFLIFWLNRELKKLSLS